MTFSDENMNRLAELTVMVGTIVVTRLMSKAKKRPTHARVEELHGPDLRINAALDEALFVTGANRVYVSQYRNGVMLESGNPLMKKVRTHERMRSGYAGQVSEYKTVALSRVPEEFTLVRADGPQFTAVHALPAGEFRSMCESEGIIAVARVAIRRGPNIVGFLGADYGTDERPENIAELEKQAGIICLELARTAVNS